ncbi:MAG: class I SAM-dependent methyltransferase [Dokdonia sp.]|jgi:SAM-dependent methyltransferase
MRKNILACIGLGLLCSTALAQEIMTTYTYKPGDVNGTGKWYMDREIAYVMGYQGMDWLERREREAEEKTSVLLKNMDIQPSDHIADIGAGSGYHIFKMAPLTQKGQLYAIDIQDEMLAAIRDKKKASAYSHISIIKGGEKAIHVAPNTLDKVLMVDVYHEFSYPKEMMASIYKALKPDGAVYLIEYRSEDARIPIKTIHKMSEKQALLEMDAAGFRLERNIDNLPWQHCMVFVKK